MIESVVVKKFGGTSVGTLERMDFVAERIQRAMLKGEKPVLVASAMAGETNRLVDLAYRLNPTYRGAAYDMLLASGEQVSIALLSMALEKRNIRAQPLLAYQLGIRTDSVFSKARIKEINTEKIFKLLSENIVPVIAGFQGIDENDNVTTLGRGGSDTTGVAVAAALRAPTCEIYTDVPSVFTADPRLVRKAREMSRISFEEMMEMASLGSKVLHIRSVELGLKYGVKIHLRSTFEEREGTWIVPEGEIMEKAVVSAVTHDASTVVFKLFPIPKGPQFLASLFTRLAERGVVVDIITQSESPEGQRLAFSIPKEDHSSTLNVLSEFLEPQIEVTVLEDQAKISVVGVGMRTHFGVAARFFTVLARLQIPVHIVTTSEIKISAVIEPYHLQNAAEALHTEFSLDRADAYS